jgi:hypothetical protein
MSATEIGSLMRMSMHPVLGEIGLCLWVEVRGAEGNLFVLDYGFWVLRCKSCGVIKAGWRMLCPTSRNDVACQTNKKVFLDVPCAGVSCSRSKG